MPNVNDVSMLLRHGEHPIDAVLARLFLLLEKRERDAGLAEEPAISGFDIIMDAVLPTKFLRRWSNLTTLAHSPSCAECGALTSSR